MTGPPPVRVERADVETVRPLRAAVLRAGLPLGLSSYPSDDLPTTVHLAAYAPDGSVAAVASFAAGEACPDRPDEPAWRLRGMATDPVLRRQGFASALLLEGQRLAAAAGARLVWGNCRTGALSFYRRHGWTVVGEEFQVEHGGPHYRAWVELA